MGRCFNETTLYTNGKQVLTIWKGADCLRVGRDITCVHQAAG
ncbi:hypothetical protein CLOSTMETH_01067 [[Clostridium] methylpentosum DSM 5476]|uniref:Uncharacterized protein n=1 Tax=[Clostridium] methylpentosum DSM 5476 TaxID=537013 RepID=C0EB50_9FIRM|nr:hypothetical protein CLOSTMETH_01067 [[Clostridium] methylpentosum DSM 5476]